jgi:hypothetical protein
MIGEPCELCGKPVPDYVPQYCCNGAGCSCHGLPIEPCVCSERCWDALTEHTGKPYSERRRLAGIPLWTSKATKSDVDIATGGG